MMYCAAVRRIPDTFSSRPNISQSLVVRRWSLALRVDFIVSRNEFTEVLNEVTEVTIPCQGLTTIDQRRLSRSLLKLVQQEIQPYPHKRVRQPSQQSVDQAETLRHIHHVASYGEINRSMHQVEAHRDQKAGASVFHVEFHSQ